MQVIVAPLQDKELLLELVRALVEYPESARVEEIAVREGTAVLKIYVAKEDVGKIIGKGGKTAEALRTIFIGIASLDRRRVFIEIEEPRKDDRNLTGGSVCGGGNGGGSYETGGGGGRLKSSLSYGVLKRTRSCSSIGAIAKMRL